jgi:hypothetical protein
LLIVNCIFSEIIEVNCCKLNVKVERKIESRNARQTSSDFDKNSDFMNKIQRDLSDDIFISSN